MKTLAIWLRRTRTRHNATLKATPQMWTGKRWDRNLSSVDHLSMCHSGGVTVSFKLKRGWRSRMNTSDQATGGLCRCIGSRDRPANGFELGTRWGVFLDADLKASKQSMNKRWPIGTWDCFQNKPRNTWMQSQMRSFETIDSQYHLSSASSCRFHLGFYHLISVGLLDYTISIRSRI